MSLSRTYLRTFGVSHSGVNEVTVFRHQRKHLRPPLLVVTFTVTVTVAVTVQIKLQLQSAMKQIHTVKI